MIPNNQKSLWLWSLFLFLYPSIYWFIPNVLREAVFFLCLVRVLKHSILIKNSRLISYNSILLVIFSIFVSRSTSGASNDLPMGNFHAI